MCLWLFVNFDVMFLPTHALSLHAAASVFMPGDKKTCIVLRSVSKIPAATRMQRAAK